MCVALFDIFPSLPISFLLQFAASLCTAAGHCLTATQHIINFFSDDNLFV